MRFLNILFLSLVLSLGYSCSNANKADTSAQEANIDDNVQSNSLLIGIWHNQKDSRYYYEYRPNGEYIRYKKHERDNICQKLFGTYTADGNTIKSHFNGYEDNYEFHIDNNNTLIILFDDGEKKY